MDFKRQFGEGVGGTPPGRTDQGWEVKLTLRLVPSSNANPTMEPPKTDEPSSDTSVRAEGKPPPLRSSHMGPISSLAAKGFTL